jgi:hypothetical protein
MHTPAAVGLSFACLLPRAVRSAAWSKPSPSLQALFSTPSKGAEEAWAPGEGEEEGGGACCLALSTDWIVRVALYAGCAVYFALQLTLIVPATFLLLHAGTVGLWLATFRPSPAQLPH